MTEGSDDRLLAEQIEYYRQRATEYDAWWLREGRFDRGPEMRAAWQADIAQAEEALDRFLIAKAPTSVLEFACGTGLWTRRLAPRVATLTAIDASPEAITINRERVANRNVAYVIADAFTWEAQRRYDLVFMSFWLSHVPHSHFAAFWAGVARALAPGGTAYIIDSVHEPSSHAVDHPPAGFDGVVTRKLADGRIYRIVKIFWEPDALAQALAQCGFAAQLRRTTRYFIHGSAVRC